MPAATEVPLPGQSGAPDAPRAAASDAVERRRAEALQWDAKGRAARARGENQVAFLCFKRGLALDPNQPNLHNNLANVFLAAREMAEAERHYRIALRLKPDFALAWTNLAYALMYQDRDLEGGVACLEKSLSINPADPDASYLLGTALRRMGRPAEAIAALEESLSRGGSPGRVHYQMGLAEIQLGHDAKAHECLLRAREELRGDAYVEIEIRSIEAAARHTAFPPDSKRVAVHINQRFHYAIVAPLFDALAARHNAIFTGDGRRLADFDADVVIVADAQAAALRATMPGAIFVHVRHGLISKNSSCVAARASDYTCVTSEESKAWYIENGGMPRRGFWVTGYVQADPLFRKDPPRLPFSIPAGSKTVLYAPTFNDLLSSAPMLGPRTVELIRGARKDIAIIIKPHPHICSQRKVWMEWWRQAAAGDAGVFLIEDPAADLVPYLKAADLLVSDASSAALMYLALDRPIVLVTNPNAAKDKARYDPNGPEWTWRDMGEDVRDVSDLAGAVARGLDNPNAGSERRAHYRRLLFGALTDGRAVERIVANVTALPLRR